MQTCFRRSEVSQREIVVRSKIRLLSTLPQHGRMVYVMQDQKIPRRGLDEEERASAVCLGPQL
jgi:hypothetical protein